MNDENHRQGASRTTLRVNNQIGLLRSVILLLVGGVVWLLKQDKGVQWNGEIVEIGSDLCSEL